VEGGQVVEVSLEFDGSPREVDVPVDLKQAMQKADVLQYFETLAFSRRKEHVKAINDAKSSETRHRSIDKIVADLKVK